MRMKKRTYINFSLSFAIALMVIALYYGQIPFLQSFESKTYDIRFKLRGNLQPADNIAIVAIDEHSIEELGRFPWTRTAYAGLIDRVSKAGASALLFDAFFSERESRRADKAFANSLKRSGITILPVVIEFSKNGDVVRVIKNLPELEAGAKDISHINMTPDEDGVVRRTPLLIAAAETVYPSLGLLGAKEAMKTNEVDVAEHEITLGKTRIPVDGRMKMLINYTGTEGLYKRYSFSDILKGRIPAEELKGKILVVGATAIGIYDLRVTPFSNNTPGVEVNTNIIDNIAHGIFMRKGRAETIIDIISIALLTIIVSSVTLSMRPLIALPFVMTLVIGYSAFAYQMFLSGRWLSIVYPVLSILFAYPAAASQRFFIVEKKAREMRAMFSSYVSKKIVDELVKHPEMAKVGGAKKTLTILFSDVRGYTSFSEKHTPEEVVNTLNEFLAEMTDEIMAHDGTLDKFLGDGIMAFWGAPVEQKNHPELAVRCALAMLKRMKRLQDKWASEGRELLDCGVGINTGDVIVGNIGVEGKKTDFTAIGDNVNLTHRLQNLSREAGMPVISEALYLRVKDIVDAEYIREVLVKGKEIPLKIYGLKGMKNP